MMPETVAKDGNVDGVDWNVMECDGKAWNMIERPGT